MDIRTIKRLCIYFFYDKDGVADDYVIYYLSHMSEFFSEICVVVNGSLTEESHNKIKPYCSKLIIRDNIGFDAWAYKEALESYGFDYIAKNFDEVLLNNFTVYGPIGSFKPMFAKMHSSICDFWGHCRYYPAKGQQVCGQNVPEHIMSYFILFRKQILQSRSFQFYFDTLHDIKNYDDARLYHEFRMTQYFEKLGYISDCFIDSKANSNFMGINTSVELAHKQLINEKSPILKRKALFLVQGQPQFNSDANSAIDIISHISKNKLYNIKLCFDNLIRTGNFEIQKNTISIFKKIRYYILWKIFKIKKYKQKFKKSYAINLKYINKILIKNNFN